VSDIRLIAIALLAVVVAVSGCTDSNATTTGDTDLAESRQIYDVSIVDTSELELSQDDRVNCEKYLADDQGESVSDSAKCYKQDNGGILVR